MIFTVDQLSRVAAAGGGLALDGSLFTFNQIKEICVAAATGSATLTLHNVGNLTAGQLTELSALAPGLVTFDLTR
jgi:DNA replication protein